MKKSILSFIVACLSLTSSLITIQAAAQDNLTEGQVRNIVTSMTHHSSATSSAAVSPTSSLSGPRFEIVPMPNYTTMWFKFDKETGDTWVVDSKSRETTCRLIGKDTSENDEIRPGEINYQLLVNAWNHLTLLNVHTGTMWEAKLQRGSTFGDFKEIGN